MPENNGVIGLSTVSPESQAATDAMFAGVDAASNSPVMSTTKNEDERKRFDAGIAKLSGPFGTILNVVNRPFSAVMGALDPIDAWAVHNVVPFMEADGQKAPTALQVPGQMRSNIKDALWTASRSAQRRCWTAATYRWLMHPSRSSPLLLWLATSAPACSSTLSAR